jgi:hypothetical protein
MSDISIGEVVGEGFRLIVKRPVSVLTWGAVRTALSALGISLLAPFWLQTMNRISTQAAAGGAAAPPPDLSQMLAVEGASWLVNFGSMVLGAVLYCAIARAVLFPERRAWAYMRIGAPEIFLFLLMFGATIVLGIGVFVAVFPIAIMVGIAVAAHAAVLGVLFGILGGLAAIGVLVWLFTRFSLLGAMMVQDGKFHFQDAWALTRGRFWSLFLLGLLLVVIVLVLQVLVGVVAVAIGFGVVGASGLDLKTLFQRPPAEIMAAVTPALILLGLIYIPIQGALYAIIVAPWARVYRELAQPDVAATFA